jgi:hypothetical protein
MWGSPAVPRTSARPSETSSIVLGQHQERQQHRAGHEQDRLDDLDPGGSDHPPEGHVDDHQDADADDRADRGGVPLQAEQQLHQRPGTDHLRDQVDDGHADGGQRRRRAHRPLPHPVGQHVGHGVLAGVPQQLGDQDQHGQVGDQPADRVQEAVVAEQRDQPGDAEEAGGRHVVAGDGDAVLPALDAPAGRVEVGGGPGLPRRPDGDAEGDEHEGREQGDRECLVVHSPASLIRVRRSLSRRSAASGSMRRLAQLV